MIFQDFFERFYRRIMMYHLYNKMGHAPRTKKAGQTAPLHQTCTTLQVPDVLPLLLRSDKAILLLLNNACQMIVFNYPFYSTVDSFDVNDFTPYPNHYKDAIKNGLAKLITN
jgi:hypothetical protein